MAHNYEDSQARQAELRQLENREPDVPFIFHAMHSCKGPQLMKTQMEARFSNSCAGSGAPGHSGPGN